MVSNRWVVRTYFSWAVDQPNRNGGRTTLHSQFSPHTIFFDSTTADAASITTKFRRAVQAGLAGGALGARTLPFKLRESASTSSPCLFGG